MGARIARRVDPCCRRAGRRIPGVTLEQIVAPMSRVAAPWSDVNLLRNLVNERTPETAHLAPSRPALALEASL